MTITTDQVLSGLQIVALLMGFGGVAFTLGRLFQRVDTVARAQDEMKEALFGGEDQAGTFLRRTEAEILMRQATREHEAFDRRLTEFAARIGRLEVGR